MRFSTGSSGTQASVVAALAREGRRGREADKGGHNAARQGDDTRHKTPLGE